MKGLQDAPQAEKEEKILPDKDEPRKLVLVKEGNKENQILQPKKQYILEMAIKMMKKRIPKVIKLTIL